MRIEAERLIAQGERDLENAGKNLGIEAYEVAVFLAHQAVEKFLKAAWIVRRREAAPRTHSLIELGSKLGVPDDVHENLTYLNPDYTISRYPDAANGVPYEAYTRQLAASKVEAGREAIGWLRSFLAEEDS